MQNANQGKQAACGVDINLGFATEAFLQYARALIVDAAACHVDGFDLAGGKAFDSLEIRLADLEIVFHDLAKGAKRQMKRANFFSGFSGDIKHKAALADGKGQAVGAGLDGAV